MVKVGDEFEDSGIVVKIMEMAPYFSASGSPSYMVGYIIKDGKYTSPTAHFWMLTSGDIKREVKKIVAYYNEIKIHLVGPAPPSPPPAPSKG